jgi:hypothetical protein
LDADRAFVPGDGDMPHVRDAQTLRSEDWREIAGALKVGNVGTTLGGVVGGRSPHAHRKMIPVMLSAAPARSWPRSVPVL